MKNKFLHLTILALLLSVGSKLMANPYIGTDGRGYESCTGRVVFGVGIYNQFSGGDDDYLKDAELFYKNTSGNWISYFKMDQQTGSGRLVVAGYSGQTWQSLPSNNNFSVYLHNTKNGFTAINNSYDITTWTEEPGNGRSSAFIALNKLPNDILISPTGSMEFRVAGHWYNFHDQSDATDAFSNDYTISLVSISAPVSLSASTDQCGKINVSWSASYQYWQSSFTCPSFGSYGYKLFCNGIEIADVGNQTNYTVNMNTTLGGITFNINTDYNFTVKTYWKAYLNTRMDPLYSSETPIAIGHTKPPPLTPTNFVATDTKCDGTIDLSWQQDVTNLDHFAFAHTIGGAPFVWVTGISGSVRNYNGFNLATRGVNTGFHLYAYNSCGVSSSSPAIDYGISPTDPAMATNISATTNTVTNEINVAWTDNAINETKYEIVRTDDQGNTVLTQINANQTSYNDNAAAACRLYTYKVRTYNDCVLSGITSTTQAQATLPPPNLGNTFTSTKKLTASKGYFSNRVELAWSNNNGLNIDVFKIYRKQLGTALDSVQITAANPNSALYIDNTADARVFYRYTIVGAKNCNGSELLTNISSDIGFRNPTGLVSGHIEYTGGVAVSGAKVLVQQSGSTLAGNSLLFSPNGTLTINDDAKLEPGGQMRCEFWVKPTNVNGAIIKKANAFEFIKNGANYEANIFIGTSKKTLLVPSALLANGQWSHVSLSYNGNAFKAFVNSVFSSSLSVTGVIDDNSNNLIFGDVNSSFNLDEFRLIGQTQVDSIVTTDANRILNGDETAFKCNLHFNEAVGSYAYDVSKVGNIFNTNHAQLSASNVSWSADIPTTSQLGYFGVTDALGNYNVSGIQYLGTGENYNLVPIYQTHAFSPNSRAVFIGDAANVYNNQDFTDISSFPVTGTLFYKNTTCPVSNANLKIDGQIVIKNGQPVTTDAAGTFSVAVPIGNHFVTIEKTLHDMEAGRYPVTGTFNFQAPVSGIQFTDSTKVIVTGRVVGGKVEADKKPGMGRSKNNIGVAKIEFATPITGAPCFTTSVLTNSITGEYSLRVPPLDYKVTDAFVVTNSILINKTKLSNTANVIALSNPLSVTKIVDSVFVANVFTGVVDSAKFHKRLDFIYYEQQKNIVVTRPDGSMFIGEDTLREGTTKISIKPIPNNAATLGNYGWGVFNWPVFEQNKSYTLNFLVTENYTNTDNNKVDTVRLSGSAVFNNEMLHGADPNATVNFSNGAGIYTFVCGYPNTAVSAINPVLDYTKDLQIQFLIDGSSPINWEPNSTMTDKDYHAIVLGAKSQGNGVATQGPELVEFILRDPPGSGSFAKWNRTTSINYMKSYSAGGSTQQGVSGKTKLGPVFSSGIGVLVEQETFNSFELGLQTTFGGRDTGDSIQETTTGFEVQTRDSPDFVGANADIFVGDSKNWLFGPTINIELIDAANCTSNCFGPTINGKRFSRLVGFKISEGAAKTKFAYTQKEIEENVIPTLETIRNTLITKPGSVYTTTVSITDWRFGSNNDDPLWLTNVSSNTPNEYDYADTTGFSYTFKGRLKGTVDSVRHINDQIRLWKVALKNNEQEKYSCFMNANGSNFEQNYTLGSSIISVNTTSSKTIGKVNVFEFQMNESVVAELGATIGGLGVVVKPSLTLEQKTESSITNQTITANSYDYTFTDGDLGDIITFDSYKTAYGNVFITRGGQTKCPYEGSLKLSYYNPLAPGAYITSHTGKNSTPFDLNNATIQREVPELQVVSPPSLYNIPSDQTANFQIQLSNQSLLTINNSVPFRVYIDGISNPNGAVCQIDGTQTDVSFWLNAGASALKTISVTRGPIETDYDSLRVILESQCSYLIADTIYISAHFIPTCTDLELSTPVNNFVINNSTNSLQNIVIDNYDYNFGVAQNTNSVTSSSHPSYGLEKIGFEFKPSNTSTWLQIEEFYKNTAVALAAGASTLYPIPNGQVYTPYTWTVTPNNYADGNYEIRAKSSCYNKDGSYAVIYSPVLQGVMDRVNPAPFGTPSPGDGILDPNDDISIQFNEPLDISSLNYAPSSNPNSTFDIRGVLNGTAIRHSESLNFDGTADYAEVTGGASLQKRSFTFEFWAKFNSTGAEQTVVSQGTDAIQKMSIGFDATNRLKFALGSQTALSTNPIALTTNWHHYAVVYDYPNSDVSLFVDGALAGTNNNFLVDYLGTGKLAFGKALPANNNFLNGNAHEIRLWSKVRTISEITVTMNKVLSRNQSGLLYNWKMDEATGALASDDIRSRNADIYGATWEINPNGNAVQLTSATNDNIKVSSGNIAINKKMDFTLEFWFNSTQPGVSTLFSNGEGIATTADSVNAWTIQKDAAGAIHVYHKGLDFVASTTNYYDGNWHHFALVMQRTGNLSTYIDGNLQNSVQGINFNNLAGANMYLGAKAVIAGSTTTLSNYFDGKMDEFRLWSTARKTEQIKRDKQNRMLGNEHGLLAYLPFENYTVVLGTPSLTPTFNNQSLETLTITAQGSASLIAQTPTLKLPRPIQSVNYTWSLNNDKIILSTNTSPDQLENVTLDITVKNALDMHGNKMQSPKTWIAYINKNQVKWQDDEFDFEKTVDSVITFVAPIVNSGGAQKAFTIGGLPSWMTANVTNGTIAPNSLQNIVFTIPAGGSIGEYNADVTVTTDFGYDEVLRVNLKVKGTAPTWSVNPNNFQYQMNAFGQFKIDNVISTNPESKIAAFNNGVICGVANLQYVPAYDRYEAFLNVYSNQITGDSIRFNIYDASTGITFVSVTPKLMFVENDVQGTVSNPITFVANTEVAFNIPLNAGWTWFSLPLKSSKLSNSNLLMNSVSSTNGDVVRSNTQFDQYSGAWYGNISQGSGYFNNQTYKVKLANVDTLVHIGSRLNPDSVQANINVVPGWNWIGFIANKNLTISEAMGNYNAQTGDLLKSQYQFAYYDNLNGWSGNLTFLKPTLGYMLKSSGTSVFNYPLSGFNARQSNANEGVNTSQSVFPFTPEQYANTMSAIITGNICNESLDQGNVVVGVFDNTNSLRGYAYPIKNNTTNKYNFYLTAYSNINGESLNVKYFNITNGAVLSTNKNVTFATDGIVGSPSNPVVAFVDDSVACNVVLNTTSVNEIDSNRSISVYPNPFNESITIHFNSSVTCNVELVDMLGKVVHSSSIKHKKEYNILTDVTRTNISAGMYYIRLTGDINQQIKVIKTK